MASDGTVVGTLGPVEGRGARTPGVAVLRDGLYVFAILAAAGAAWAMGAAWV